MTRPLRFLPGAGSEAGSPWLWPFRSLQASRGTPLLRSPMWWWSFRFLCRVSRSDGYCAALLQPRHLDPRSTTCACHGHSERPVCWFSIRFLREVGCWREGVASSCFSCTSFLSRKKRMNLLAGFFDQCAHLRVRGFEVDGEIVVAEAFAGGRADGRDDNLFE